MSQLVLSLFPGADLLGMAFELEGFTVVQGPDVIFGRDIRNFHPPAGRFDGVIGGPPCQAFSRLRHLVEANGYAVAENLIPEFERCVLEASPAWFLMENVEAAPGPEIDSYRVGRHNVTDVHVGGLTSRKRAFHFGQRMDGVPGRIYRDLAIEWSALHAIEPEPTVCASGGGTPSSRSRRRQREGQALTDGAARGHA